MCVYPCFTTYYTDYTANWVKSVFDMVYVKLGKGGCDEPRLIHRKYQKQGA